MAEKTVLTSDPFELNYPSQYVEVLGSRLRYIEQGSGDPILLLHGIPASSYVWRNIIPFLAPLGRCIAVDLVGMGKSDKPDIAYTILDHIRYIEKFVETKRLNNITLVMHGWGSLIGFDYAMRHEDNCKGLVFYEAFLRQMQGDNLSLLYQQQLAELQKQNASSSLAGNADFISKYLSQSMMHHLTASEQRYYRECSSEKAIRQYWNELPRGDGNSKADQLIARYSEKLMRSKLPKLLLYSIPGFITTIATVMWAKENLSQLEVGGLGEELHFAQETNPMLMGELMSAWLQAVEQEV